MRVSNTTTSVQKNTMYETVREFFKWLNSEIVIKTN